ncbi:hypothetical protein FPQ18DRAFT_416410 [Pyronema domesticum]|nr:hypothetical protein FPQ18DRAFT_416410 [Pyronema domesticum]
MNENNQPLGIPWYYSIALSEREELPAYLQTAWHSRILTYRIFVMALAHALENTNHRLNTDDVTFILWIAESITCFPWALEGLDTSVEDQSYRSALIGLMMSAVKVPLLPPAANLRKACMLLRAMASITELLDADVSADNGTMTIRQYLNAMDTILLSDIGTWDNGRLGDLSDLTAIIHRTFIDYYGFPDGIDYRQQDDEWPETALSIRLLARDIRSVSDGTLDVDSDVSGGNIDSQSLSNEEDTIPSERAFKFILLAMNDDVCKFLFHAASFRQLSRVELRVLRLREALEIIIGNDVDHSILQSIENRLGILIYPFDDSKEPSTVEINGLNWNTMSAQVRNITSSQQETLRLSLQHSLRVLRKIELRLLSTEAGVSMISTYIYLRVLGLVCQREENWKESYRNPFEELARQCIPQLRPEELLQYLNAQPYGAVTQSELREILQYVVQCRSSVPGLVFDAMVHEVERLSLYHRMGLEMPENVPTHNQRPLPESSNNEFNLEFSTSSSVESEQSSAELFDDNFYSGFTILPSSLGTFPPPVTPVSEFISEAHAVQETVNAVQASRLNIGTNEQPAEREALRDLPTWQDRIDRQPPRYRDGTPTTEGETFHWLWRDFDDELLAFQKRDILTDILLAVTQDRYDDMPVVDFRYNFTNNANDKAGTSAIFVITLTTVDQPLLENTVEAFAAYRDRLRMMARIGEPDSKELQIEQRGTLPRITMSRYYESWS